MYKEIIIATLTLSVLLLGACSRASAEESAADIESNIRQILASAHTAADEGRLNDAVRLYWTASRAEDKAAELYPDLTWDNSPYVVYDNILRTYLGGDDPLLLSIIQSDESKRQAIKEDMDSVVEGNTAVGTSLEGYTGPAVEVILDESISTEDRKDFIITLHETIEVFWPVEQSQETE